MNKLIYKADKCLRDIKIKKTEFNLFKEINSNFEVIESLTESNNIICGFVDIRHSSEVTICRNWLSAVQLTITNEY